MKPTDLTPNKIEEAPMGALSKVGNYLGSKLPTFAPDLANRATGNLNTGAVANQAWASYQQYLGQTEGVSAKPTKKSVLAWLKIKKYSPDAINAADQVIDKSETAKTAKTATDAADAKKTADFWHAQYESKKPAHHLDIMRSYLDILSEKTIAEAAPAAALLRPSAPAAGGGAAAPAAPAAPTTAAPAAPTTAAPAAPTTAAPAAASTGVLTSKVASQAIMAAAQAQAAEQYTQPQAAPAAAPQQAPATSGAGVAAAQSGILGGGGGGGGGGGTPTASTGAASVAPTGGTTSATDDPQQMAKQLAGVLQPLSRDPKAQALLDAIAIYTALPDRRAAREDTVESKFDNMTEGMFTKSLKFSESFNPGKMLEKKVTKLTRIK